MSWNGLNLRQGDFDFVLLVVGNGRLGRCVKNGFLFFRR